MGYALRGFGRGGAVGHQAVDGLEKSNGGAQKLHADKISFAAEGCGLPQVPDSSVSESGLAIEHQADPLNGLDSQRLVGFDQRSMVRNIVDANRVTRIKGAPEGPEDLKPNPISTVTWRSHLSITVHRRPCLCNLFAIVVILPPRENSTTDP